MTARAQISFAPRLLQAPDAAAYLGVSVTTLRALPIPRKTRGANRLYDRIDLDAFANGLPYEGETESGANSCDALFGGNL